MATALYTHPVCIDHEPGPGHPESPDRLRSVLKALQEAEFDDLVHREAAKAERAWIERVHDAAYFDWVFSSVPQSGYHALDPDTILSPASGEAALRAAGALCAATEAVASREIGNAFCAVRPPGHHAERSQAMGFCLFGNVAIGALHAQRACGIGKVAVVDFDVHHGNGTQDAFIGRENVFFASSHQFPAYPGTGAESIGDNIVNVPLPPGSGSSQFRTAYEKTIFPALEDFAPDMLFISAGFDAHIRDPLCQLQVTTDDFGWVSEKLADIAARHCDGRLVSTLEGGYDLEALGDCVAVHVAALMKA